LSKLIKNKLGIFDSELINLAIENLTEINSIIIQEKLKLLS